MKLPKFPNSIKTGEPYLNFEEFTNLRKNLFNKNSLYQNEKETIQGWKNPKLSDEEIKNAYKKANPDVIKLAKGTTNNKIKNILDKINKLEEEMTQALYETMVFARK